VLCVSTAALSLLLSGCILQNDNRTFYLHEDGKVDMVMLLDDIHSSEAGNKGKAEEAGWLSDFKRGATPELERLKEAGATGVKSEVVRDRAPFSAVVSAQFDSVRDLGAFLEISSADAKSGIELTKNGVARTFSIHIVKEKPASGKTEPESSEETDADRRIIWRFVPLDGKVASAKACLVSEDKSSCLMDLPAIWREQKRGTGAIEVSLSWTVEEGR
jgi:hypothetical protein